MRWFVMDFRTFKDINEIADNSFEFIFAMNVLEHIEDDRAMLCRLGEKLKKGGKLLVYVPLSNVYGQAWTKE